MSRLRAGGEIRSAAESRVTGQDYGLIAVLDPDLVEDPRDVIANGFFRQPKRIRDLRIVEAFGDAFEHGPLARRELVDRQRIPARRDIARFGEKAAHLGIETGPRRLV